MGYRAVIFDLGGVVFPSPFDTFDAYERAHGLPARFIRGVVAATADHGAWAHLERNDVTFAEFCVAFEAECAAAGGTVDATELMAAVGNGFEPRPEMLCAIAAIRQRGLLVGALTNNWVTEAESTIVHGSFDVVVESAVEGLRKPDPRIYQLTCERLAVAPRQVVLLDDLGVNLKPARAMGMTTIKVADPTAAIAELSEVLELPLDGS